MLAGLVRSQSDSSSNPKGATRWHRDGVRAGLRGCRASADHAEESNGSLRARVDRSLAPALAWRIVVASHLGSGGSGHETNRAPSRSNRLLAGGVSRLERTRGRM